MSDADRVEAWSRIRAAARRFGVDLHERDWRELFTDGAGGRAG